MKPNLTQDRLRELLLYDAETGIFTRRIKTGRVLVGDVAGSLHQKGYREIKVDYKHYFAHRLAWFYVHGVWPKDQIDHINGVKDDNRICNLREATNAENNQNQRKASRNSRSGLLGVCTSNNRKPRAMIRFNGKRLYIGTFDTPELAHAAYLVAKEKLHPFARPDTEGSGK
jgi:hypothetical protein